MNSANARYSDLGVSSTALTSLLEGYADLETSADAVAHDKQRYLLTKAIECLPAIAVARGLLKALSTVSLAAATAFVQNLPTNRALPKVAPDEDGDILMAWDTEPGRCALTVEGVTLHMVVNPGAHSQHIEPTIYHGGHIPPKLLRHLPLR